MSEGENRSEQTAAVTRPLQTSFIEGAERPVGTIGTGPVNARLRTIRRTRRAHSYLIVFRRRKSFKVLRTTCWACEKPIKPDKAPRALCHACACIPGAT